MLWLGSRVLCSCVMWELLRFSSFFFCFVNSSFISCSFVRDNFTHLLSQHRTSIFAIQSEKVLKHYYVESKPRAGTKWTISHNNFFTFPNGNRETENQRQNTKPHEPRMCVLIRRAHGMTKFDIDLIYIGRLFSSKLWRNLYEFVLSYSYWRRWRKTLHKS